MIKKLIPRNGAAVAARFRHAGPMQDVRDKRSKEQKDWAEEYFDEEEIKMKEINIVQPIMDFANKKIDLSELGRQVAQCIEMYPEINTEPRLLRIRDKFANVESQDRFDAYLNDLVHWCSFMDCNLIVPSK